MWLPVQYSFSRNKTVAAITAGKYTNIRGMFTASANTPTAGGQVWKTAQQAIEDGSETSPTYSLFDMVCSSPKALPARVLPLCVRHVEP